jgi:hypothetical protein
VIRDGINPGVYVAAPAPTNQFAVFYCPVAYEPEPIVKPPLLKRVGENDTSRSVGGALRCKITPLSTVATEIAEAACATTAKTPMTQRAMTLPPDECRPATFGRDKSCRTAS